MSLFVGVSIIGKSMSSICTICCICIKLVSELLKYKEPLVDDYTYFCIKKTLCCTNISLSSKIGVTSFQNTAI